MPMVRAVPALFAPTMVAVAIDMPVAPGAPALPSLVLATTVAVPVQNTPGGDLGVISHSNRGSNP